MPPSLCHAALGPESKDLLRRRLRAVRRDALPAVGEAIRGHAVALLPPLLPPPLRLGLYWPFGAEPDLKPWAAAGLAQRLGGRLALPAVLPPRPQEPHGRLVYRPWQRGQELRPDACGIPAPIPQADGGPDALSPEALGLLLVPALAIDGRGLRLGSGGGWYDRLRADPAWAAVPAVAVLPGACRLEVLPRDPWDVPFHGWLDESGLHWLDPALAPQAARAG